MNLFVIMTVFATILTFWLGSSTERIAVRYLARMAAICFGSVLALPAAAYAAYYTRLLGEPVWLYDIRSIPFSELASSGAGFLAGFCQSAIVHSESLRRRVGVVALPAALGLLVLLPHLKPLLRRPKWDQFADRWADGVCLQSSPSSCGPACGATLLRYLNKPATELEIAREAFTSSSGTENWYLARALRRRGVSVQFLAQPTNNDVMPFPAIAGVRVEGAGHFITILGREGEKWVIGDPLVGRQFLTFAQFQNSYQPTGFFMLVKK